MSIKSIIAAFSIILFINNDLSAQEVPAEFKQQLVTFQNSITGHAQQVLYDKTDQEKLDANELLSKGLLEALNLPYSFYFPFDSLKTISILTSADKKIRLFTWTIPLNDGTYKYRGVLQMAEKNPENSRILELTELAHDSIDEPETRQLNPEEWYGAHYYQLIDVKVKKETYYTLIGWKGNNRVTTRKVVDVLAIDKEGLPYFGKEVFVMLNEKTLKRKIFEFSTEVSMSIKYYDNTETIVMDHLFPSDPRFEGHYEFYGPDLSFDAFELSNGLWKYVDDYDPGIRPKEKEIELNEEQKIY